MPGVKKPYFYAEQLDKERAAMPTVVLGTITWQGEGGNNGVNGPVAPATGPAATATGPGATAPAV